MKNVDPNQLVSSPPPEPQRFREFETEGNPTLAWIWRGYLAAGNVTLLTSQWKTGKTTLLSVLLTKLADGGDLAGLAVARGRVAIISEESRAHWRMRGNRLGFGDHIAFFCRPFPRKPDRAQWSGLIDRLARMHAEEGLDLVVVDTLATFLPAGAESQVDVLHDVLRPLEQLTDRGPAVLLTHHPRKGMPSAGQAARGTGALSGFADILIEMHGRPAAGNVDRRRRLTAWSRYDETPRDLMIELSADGRDYAQSSEPFDEEADEQLETVVDILKQSGQRLSRHGISDNWPGKAPPTVSLWRVLERGVSRGLITKQGAGSRYDPHNYGLPGVEATFKPTLADTMDIEALLGETMNELPPDLRQPRPNPMDEVFADFSKQMKRMMEEPGTDRESHKPDTVVPKRDKNAPREEKKSTPTVGETSAKNSTTADRT